MRTDIPVPAVDRAAPRSPARDTRTTDTVNDGTGNGYFTSHCTQAQRDV